ncbi:MAG: hypothetical protein V3V05_04660 [Pontiella sp.]
MNHPNKLLSWLLITSTFSLNIPLSLAQEKISQSAETVDSSASGVPEGTAITSKRDSSTSISPVQTAVTRDAAKSEVAINWENVTLKDCIEILSRDLGMEFIISPSVNVTQEVSIRAGDVTAWDREHKLELFDAILDTAGIQRIQRGRVWVFSPSDIRPVAMSRKVRIDVRIDPVMNEIRAVESQAYRSVMAGFPDGLIDRQDDAWQLAMSTRFERIVSFSDEIILEGFSIDEIDVPFN